MAKTDKLRKVLCIILATLSIISLVFGLMKKVGLCASDSSDVITVSDFPLYYGNGFGVAGEIPLPAVINYCDSLTFNTAMGRNNRLITIYEYTDSSNFICFYYGNPDFMASDGTIRNEPTFNLNDRFIVGSFGYRYTITCTNGTFSNSYEGRGYTVYCNLSTVLENNAAGSFSYKSGTYLDYPLWFSEGYSLNFANTGNPAFILYTPSGGIDSPGFSDAFNDAYQDWVDSDLNPVDTNPPATDNNSNWFQKILNGLSTINNTIGSGFSTVFGLFGDIKDSISDKIDSFKDSLSGLAGFGSSFYDLGVQEGEFSIGTFLHNLFFCDPHTIEDIWDDSETGAAINDLKSTMGNIIACYTATPSEHVYWNFDFRNTTLFSNVGVISINFDWYNSIRTPVITLFSVFFFLGFLFLLVRKIPGIISGLSSSSDDK